MKFSLIMAMILLPVISLPVILNQAEGECSGISDPSIDLEFSDIEPSGRAILNISIIQSEPECIKEKYTIDSVLVPVYYDIFLIDEDFGEIIAGSRLPFHEFFFNDSGIGVEVKHFDAHVEIPYCIVLFGYWYDNYNIQENVTTTC